MATSKERKLFRDARSDLEEEMIILREGIQNAMREVAAMASPGKNSTDRGIGYNRSRTFQRKNTDSEMLGTSSARFEQYTSWHSLVADETHNPSLEGGGIITDMTEGSPVFHRAHSRGVKGN